MKPVKELTQQGIQLAIHVTPPCWQRGGRGEVPYLRSRMGGGTPSQLQNRGYPISDPGWGGTPPKIQDRGVPHPRSWGTTPIQVRSQVRMNGWGTPSIRTGWQYPLCPGLDGVPPRTGWGTHRETKQHSEHLLRGGWYASWVHSGELSCQRITLLLLFPGVWKMEFSMLKF